MSPHFRFIDLGSDFKPRRNKFTIRQAVIVKTNDYFITRGVFHVDANMAFRSSSNRYSSVDIFFNN